MSQMTLRLPESLHKSLKEIAEKEKISANQFVALAVAEKISALTTADLIEQRAARAPDRKRYQELLAKAPDVEPDDQDLPGPLGRELIRRVWNPPIQP